MDEFILRNWLTQASGQTAGWDLPSGRTAGWDLPTGWKLRQELM